MSAHARGELDEGSNATFRSIASFVGTLVADLPFTLNLSSLAFKTEEQMSRAKTETLTGSVFEECAAAEHLSLSRHRPGSIEFLYMSSQGPFETRSRGWHASKFSELEQGMKSL